MLRIREAKQEIMDNNNEKYSFIKNSNTIFDFLKFLLSSLLYYLLEKYNIDKNILFNTENLSGLDTNQQKYFISLTRQKLWKFDINSSQDQRLEHFKKTFIPVLRNFFNKYDYLIKLYVKCNEEPNEIIKLDCIINNYIFKDLIDNYIFITEKEKQNHGANNEVEGAEQELNKANGDYVFKFNAFKLARNVVEKAKRKLKQAKRKLKEAERKLEEAKENISKIYPVHDAKCKLKEACLKAEKAIKSENAKKLVDETRQKINEAIKVEEANINELNLVGNKVKEAERKLEEAKENRRKINPVYDAKYNLKKACLKADKAVREVEEFEEVSEEAIDKAEKAKKLVEARDKAEKLVKEARQKMNEAIKADNEANNVVNISVAKIMSG